MTEFEFDIKTRPPRPWWKDAILFCGTVFSVWGGTHLFLNFDAFAQIANFKFQTLKTSVVEKIFNPEQEKLQKIEPKIKRTTFRSRKIKPRNQAKNLLREMTVFPSDNRIVIPRIGKNVPLITVPGHKNWQKLEKNIQKGLQSGVVVHPVSRPPGEFGNFFATGHSSYYKWDPGRFKDVFALLHEVKIGDLVEVYWEGRKFVYKIREKHVVPPTEVSILSQPNDKKMITMMTCTPVGTNKNRLILLGELKE